MTINSPIDFRQRNIIKTRFNSGAIATKNDILFRCSLNECDFLIAQPCWTQFYQCTFDRCLLSVLSECRQHWNNCRWTHCRFLGDYFSVCFGHRDSDCALEEGPMVTNCDFSSVGLFEAVLFQADLATISFPKWPNVTILEPFLHKSELKSLMVPSAIQIWWDIYASGIHPSYSSTTFNWDVVVRNHKERKFVPQDISDCTDEFRNTLSRLPYVLM